MGIINDAGYFISRFWDNPFAGDDKKTKSISSRRLELYEQRGTYKAEEDRLIIAHDEAIEKNNQAKGNNFNKLLVGVAIAALAAASGVGIFALVGGTAAKMLGAAIMAAGGYKAFRSAVDFSRESRRAQLELNKDLAAISAQRQTLDNTKNERLQNYANEVDNGNFVILQDKYNQITSRGKVINPRNPLSELMKEGSVTGNGKVKYALDATELLAINGRTYQDTDRQVLMRGKLTQVLDLKTTTASSILAQVDNYRSTSKLDIDINAINDLIETTNVNAFKNNNSATLFPFLSLDGTPISILNLNAAKTLEEEKSQTNVLSLKMKDNTRLNLSLSVMIESSTESAMEAAIFNRLMQDYYNRPDNHPSATGQKDSLHAMVRDFEQGLIKFETGDKDMDKKLATATRDVVMEMVRADAVMTKVRADLSQTPPVVAQQDFVNNITSETFKKLTYANFLSKNDFKAEHEANYTKFKTDYDANISTLRTQTAFFNAGALTPAGIKEIEKWLVAEGTKLHEEQGYSIEVVTKFMDKVSKDDTVAPSNDNTVNPLVAAAHAAAGRA